MKNPAYLEMYTKLALSPDPFQRAGDNATQSYLKVRKSL